MTRKKLLSFRARVVKDINEQLVLNLIQENEIISSTDLVKITGMRPSTIFNILKVLSERSLVSFHGKGDSTEKGGKKPYLWRLNKEAAYIIGLDIEVGEIASVILDFSGKIIAKKIIKLETGKTLDEFAGTIIKVVNEIITENNIVKEMIFPLLQKLSSLPFPVLIENNANAAAIGLKWNGYNETRRNFLIILLDIDRNVSGLGIGIIIDGELYRGSSFCAGELYPHLPTLKEILSTMRSRFIEGKILKKYVSSPESIDIEIFIDAVKQGDEIARIAFSKIGDVVGQTIAPAVALLNPDTLIITGVVSEVEDILIESVRKAIEMRVLSITSNTLNIVADKYHHYSKRVARN